MNLVDQTIFGMNGNCMSAVLATLLEKPLEEVPHFTKHFSSENPTEYDNYVFHKQVTEYLDSQDLKLSWVTYDHNADYSNVSYMIVSGESNRGRMHGVIYKNGKPFHDPHPDRTFVRPQHIAFLREKYKWNK